MCHAAARCCVAAVVVSIWKGAGERGNQLSVSKNGGYLKRAILIGNLIMSNKPVDLGIASFQTNPTLYILYMIYVKLFKTM